MLIDIEKSVVDAVVITALNETLESLEGYLEDYKVGGIVDSAMFDTDPRKDMKMIKKHIKAINLLLDYYC